MNGGEQHPIRAITFNIIKALHKSKLLFLIQVTKLICVQSVAILCSDFRPISQQ